MAFFHKCALMNRTNTLVFLPLASVSFIGVRGDKILHFFLPLINPILIVTQTTQSKLLY